MRARKKVPIIIGGLVAMGLALATRSCHEDTPPPTAEDPAEDEKVFDAGLRWGDGQRVERAEFYPEEFEFADQTRTVTLHEDVSALEAQFCHPIARALCQSRAECGCPSESLQSCQERERSLCKRSLACDFWTEDAHELVVDSERMTRCIAEVREDFARCSDDRLPEVCLRVLIVPVAIGEACPPYGRWCRGGVCTEGICRPIPQLDQRCALLRTPGVLPEEQHVCEPDALCELRADEEWICTDPQIIEGMPCQRSQGCLHGQACVEGRCGPPRIEGEPCDTRDACDSILTCRDGVCSRGTHCVRFEDCGAGQTCEGQPSMRCSASPGLALREPCRTSRSCVAGAICIHGFCETAPGPGQLPIDGRCALGSTAPRAPGATCTARHVRERSESCGRGTDICAEGLACVRRTALDGGITLPGMECVSGLGEGAECELSASRCQSGLSCRPEFSNGRCLSTLCLSMADIWSCQGAPTAMGDY